VTQPRRHLLDPNNLPQRTASQSMSLTQVQRWVLSVLAATTILHLAAGLVVAAAFVERDRLDARIGLLVIAGCFGVLAVAAGRAIHQKSLLSPWLLLGWLPAAIGAYVVF